MYVMHRKGKLTNKSASPNQCKVEGHDKYYYHISFVASEKLNQDGFLVDHLDIDTALQQIEIKGSCEEMHKQIHDCFLAVMNPLPCAIYAYKCVLTPSLVDAVAHMEYIKLLNDDYAKYLALL